MAYPEEANALALAAVLPSGTDVYVALFTGGPPPPLGVGTELALAGYARVAHSAWTTTNLGSFSTRANSTSITFAPIDAAGSCDTWLIYDSAVGGVFLRGGGLGGTVSFDAGDILRFPIGGLRITIEDT